MNRLLVVYGLALIVYLIAVASFGGTLTTDKGAFSELTLNGSNVLTSADSGDGENWSGYMATQAVDMAGFGLTEVSYIHMYGNNVSVGGGTPTSGNNGVSIGSGADGTDTGTAVGYQSDASFAGVAIGALAKAPSFGIALGLNTIAGSNCVAIGNTTSNSSPGTTKIYGTLTMPGGGPTAGAVLTATNASGETSWTKNLEIDSLYISNPAIKYYYITQTQSTNLADIIVSGVGFKPASIHTYCVSRGSASSDGMWSDAETIITTSTNYSGMKMVKGGGFFEYRGGVGIIQDSVGVWELKLKSVNTNGAVFSATAAILPTNVTVYINMVFNKY